MKEKYLETINKLSDKELLLNLFASQGMLFMLGIVLSLFFFDSLEQVMKLFQWDDSAILTVGLTLGVVVVLIDILFMRFLPHHYFDDGGVNERLFKKQSIGSIFFITLVVAIVEEFLFRGVIQTTFGLLVSSIIFALIHYRYLFNLFLFLNVVVISFVMGLVFYITNNLLVTIMMHFVIDFILGLLYRQKFGGGR